MANSFVNLPYLSRYKDTPVYDEGGALEFELWAAPPEFGDQGTAGRTHRVTQHEVGFLDIIAVRYFGRGFESAWWAIAQANGIIDPEREMFAGMALIIPPKSRVTQYLSRPGNGA